jgi:hypothetical protein
VIGWKVWRRKLEGWWRKYERLGGEVSLGAKVTLLGCPARLNLLYLRGSLLPFHLVDVPSYRLKKMWNIRRCLE